MYVWTASLNVDRLLLFLLVLFHSPSLFYVLIYMLCFTSPARPPSPITALPLLIKLHMCMYSLFRLHCIIHPVNPPIPFVLYHGRHASSLSSV